LDQCKSAYLPNWVLRLKITALAGLGAFEAAGFVADANLVVVRFVSLKYKGQVPQGLPARG